MLHTQPRIARPEDGFSDDGARVGFSLAKVPHTKRLHRAVCVPLTQPARDENARTVTAQSPAAGTQVLALGAATA